MVFCWQQTYVMITTQWLYDGACKSSSTWKIERKFKSFKSLKVLNTHFRAREHDAKRERDSIVLGRKGTLSHTKNNGGGVQGAKHTHTHFVYTYAFLTKVIFKKKFIYTLYMYKYIFFFKYYFGKKSVCVHEMCVCVFCTLHPPPIVLGMWQCSFPSENDGVSLPFRVVFPRAKMRV
jgi:hypothetical protein